MLLENLLSKDLTNKEISIVKLIATEVNSETSLPQYLGIKKVTVQKHLKNIYNKLNIYSFQEIKEYCAPYLEQYENPFHFEPPSKFFIIENILNHDEKKEYRQKMINYLYQDSLPSFSFLKNITYEIFLTSVFRQSGSNLLVLRRDDIYKTLIFMSLVEEVKTYSSPSGGRKFLYVGYSMEGFSKITISYFSFYVYFNNRNKIEQIHPNKYYLNFSQFQDLALKSEYFKFISKDTLKKKVISLK